MAAQGGFCFGFRTIITGKHLICRADMQLLQEKIINRHIETA